LIFVTLLACRDYAYIDYAAFSLYFQRFSALPDDAISFFRRLYFRCF